MVCGKLILSHPNVCLPQQGAPNWIPEELQEKIVTYSPWSVRNDFNPEGTATNDFAPPPMPQLERDTTYTEYNESSACEWFGPAAMMSWNQPMIPMLPVLVAVTPPLHPIAAPPTPGPLGAAWILDVDSSSHETINAQGSSRATSPDSSGTSVVRSQRDPTPAEKELRKLRKKVNDMTKLQDRVDSGEKLDKLQLVKLDKRHEIELEYARVEQLVAEEDKRAQQGHVQTHGLGVSAFGSHDQEQPQRQEAWSQPEQGTQPYGQWPTARAHALEHIHVTECLEAHETQFLDGHTNNSLVDTLEDRTARPPRTRKPSTNVTVSEDSCAKLLADLEEGGPKREAAITYLRARVRKLALEPVGCRVVQLAIQVAGKDSMTNLVSELHGHVQEAIQSPYGNYVIQRIVAVLPIASANFVADELRGVASTVARHRYGCRILCRLFEHSALNAAPCALADEIITEAAQLSRHTFAHHVMQAILEHGSPMHRQQIVDALVGNLWASVQDRSASYVIETALTHCGLHNDSLLDSLQHLTPHMRKSKHSHRLLQVVKSAANASAGRRLSNSVVLR